MSRIFYLLLVALLLITYVPQTDAGVIGQVEIPDYFTSRSPVGWVARGNNNNGDIEVDYKMIWNTETVNFSSTTNNTLYSINYTIAADGYGGYQTFTTHFPYIRVKFTVWGEEKLGIKYSGVKVDPTKSAGTDTGNILWTLAGIFLSGWFFIVKPAQEEVNNTVSGTLSIENKVFRKHTVLSLYHAGDSDKLIVYMTIQYSTSYPNADKMSYIADVYWLRYTYNPETGQKNITELDHVSSSGTVETGPPLTVELVMVPMFWSKQIVYGNIGTEYVMIYGYKGYVAFYSGSSAIDTGTFQFAWLTKYVGPSSQVGEDEVERFIDDIRGWYVWVGLGFRYFEPYNSLVEVIPDNWTSKYTNHFSVSLININGTAELADYSYHAYMTVQELYAEDLRVDIHTLYALFISGSLERYTGAYFEITDRYSAEYYRGLVLGILPLILALIMFGWAHKTDLAPLIGVGIVPLIGSFTGIFGVYEILAGVLGFAIVFIYRLWKR